LFLDDDLTDYFVEKVNQNKSQNILVKNISAEDYNTYLGTSLYMPMNFMTISVLIPTCSVDFV